MARQFTKGIFNMHLGKLKKVDLRSIWNNEAKDFSTWLSKEENLFSLGEEIGIDLSLIETEASVGRYSVDILAEEENTGRKIIIENQLEITDHDHLGKIITYASGYDAEIILWIVKDVRDEHKQAIDWLNDHTDEKINLFIIKIELWKIGESPVAPKFQVISKPNDWAKALRGSSKSNLTETKLLQLDFWNRFKEYSLNQNTKLKLRKAYPQHWYDISIGISKAHISLIADTQNNFVRCELYIPDSKELFHKLFENKENIESELNENLEWYELPEKKASRIVLVREAIIPDETKWEEYFNWLKIKSEDFQKVFKKYSNKINAI